MKRAFITMLLFAAISAQTVYAVQIENYRLTIDETALNLASPVISGLNISGPGILNFTIDRDIRNSLLDIQFDIGNFHGDMSNFSPSISNDIWFPFGFGGEITSFNGQFGSPNLTYTLNAGNFTILQNTTFASVQCTNCVTLKQLPPPIAQIPEPNIVMLMLLGLVGLPSLRRKFVSGALCAGLLSLGLITSAVAIPLTEQSSIYIIQHRDGSFSQRSTANTFSNTFQNNIQAFGDLTKGKVGSSSISTFTSDGIDNDSGNSQVSIFDTLNFTSTNGAPVEINYQLNYEGTLSADVWALNPAIGGSASAISGVTIYDITGLSTWLELDSNPTVTDFVTVNSAANPISGLGVFFEIDAIDNSREQSFHDQFIVDNSGAPFALNLTKTGSFIADPARDYAIGMTAFTSANLDASADFLNTGTFQFTNLNGATFNSGSGVFLSGVNQVSTPTTLPLLLAGLTSLLGLNYRKQQQFSS